MKTAQRVAIVTCFATLLLVAVGAMVRATASGLGCPDWPLCHGGAVPPGEKHALIEFSHRFTASLVGLLVIATAAYALKYYRHVPAVCWVAIANVPLVGLQGILGAITVKRELPPEIVATHLLTAMAVVSCEVFIAVGMYREGSPERRSGALGARAAGRAVGLLSLFTIAWLAATMWIGGYMAESGASTACSGWPLCNGSLLPASDRQEIVHMAHRYLVAGLAPIIIAFVVVAWRQRHAFQLARHLAAGAAALFAGQVLVGAFNVWYTFPDVLTVSHTTIAAALWAILTTAAVATLYVPAAHAIATPHRQQVPA